MKKSCFGVLIGLFLFFGSFIAVNASSVPPTGGSGGNNSAVATPSGARSTRVDVGSLPRALQGVLSARLGANNPEYRMTRSGGGYRAVNGRNGLTATIGLDGFRVRAGSSKWGLRLTAWGRTRCLRRIGAGRMISRSNRVAMDRGGIVAWWVNGPLGIEQGWTVANRPREGGNRGRLILVLRQSGDLRTEAVSGGTSLSISSDSGREVLRYAGLTAYDKTGKQLPAHFEAMGKEVRVVVDDTSAAYPLRIDPWVQAAELTASNGAYYDYLGCSVAVSADGTTVVVGEYGYNGNQGAVYVFQEPASGWASGTQTVELTASNGVAGDYLGYSVAVSADGTTVVAGAFAKNSVQGAVYVFKEPASGWASGGIQAAELTVSNSAGGEGLGYSVAVSPDGATVVAGGPYATVGSNSGQGAVYVFQKPASGWVNGTQTAELAASAGATHDYLGYSVAVSSNGAIVVGGAPFATVGNNNNQGAIYVFKEPSGGWVNGTQTAELTASNGAGGDNLGSAIAVSPEGATIVAGVPFATVGGNTDQGAVYVFQEPVSGWASGTQTAELTASNGAAIDMLGSSVAVSSEGINVVAGADMVTVAGNNGQGAVYVFKRPASGWANGTQTAELTASSGGINFELGSSVAVSPDATTVVGGADGTAVSGRLWQGAVYVFQGPLWQNALDLANGWEWLNWFGYFNITYSPWIYHLTLGWLYPVGTSTSSIWFYDLQWDGKGGWWWTSSAVYPWVYSVTEAAWLWYDAAISKPGARWFWNSNTRTWGTH